MKDPESPFSSTQDKLSDAAKAPGEPECRGACPDAFGEVGQLRLSGRTDRGFRLYEEADVDILAMVDELLALVRGEGLN